MNSLKTTIIKRREKKFSLLFLCSKLCLFSIITTTIFLSSCGGSENIRSNSIAFFNGTALQLTKKEKELPIDSLALDLYKNIWAERPIQVPFYKYIQSADYKVYLGIPFSTSLKQACIMYTMQEQPSNFIIHTDTTSYLFTSSSSDSSFVTEYFWKGENGLLFLRANGIKNNYTDSLFSENMLKSRIYSTIK